MQRPIAQLKFWNCGFSQGEVKEYLHLQTNGFKESVFASVYSPYFGNTADKRHNSWLSSYQSDRALFYFSFSVCL